jgi:hypothetical protein
MMAWRKPDPDDIGRLLGYPGWIHPDERQAYRQRESERISLNQRRALIKKYRALKRAIPWPEIVHTCRFTEWIQVRYPWKETLWNIHNKNPHVYYGVIFKHISNIANIGGNEVIFHDFAIIKLYKSKPYETHYDEVTASVRDCEKGELWCFVHNIQATEDNIWRFHRK